MEENKSVNKGTFTFVDLSNQPDQPYKSLVIFKSYMAEVTDIEEHLDAEFSGDIIIDTMFSTGNNSNRFIKAQVEKGKLVFGAFEIVAIDRREPLRELSNLIIAQDPHDMEASVLLSHQKKLLAKGVSI